MNIALYQLAPDFRQAAERLADLDLPPEVVADTLEAISGDLDMKAQNVAMFAANLEATAKSIKQAEQDMKKRREAIEKRAQSLRAYMLRCMNDAGIRKIEGPYLRISVRDNPPAVDVFDTEQLPSMFMRQPPPPAAEPDKAAIKEALKAGLDVPGARLSSSQRLDIAA